MSENATSVDRLVGDSFAPIDLLGERMLYRILQYLPFTSRVRTAPGGWVLLTARASAPCEAVRCRRGSAHWFLETGMLRAAR